MLENKEAGAEEDDRGGRGIRKREGEGKGRRETVGNERCELKNTQLVKRTYACHLKAEEFESQRRAGNSHALLVNEQTTMSQRERERPRDPRWHAEPR